MRDGRNHDEVVSAVSMMTGMPRSQLRLLCRKQQRAAQLAARAKRDHCIRQLHQDGIHIAEIARRIGVHRATVARILNQTL